MNDNDYTVELLFLFKILFFNILNYKFIKTNIINISLIKQFFKDCIVVNLTFNKYHRMISFCKIFSTRVTIILCIYSN